MKRLNLFLIGCVFIFISLMGEGKQIPVDKASQVALNAILERFPGTIAEKREMGLSEPVRIFSEGRLVWYIFNVRDSRGFLMISADDRVPPLLAWSSAGTYEAGKPVSPAFTWYMDRIAAQILVIMDQDKPASDETSNAWTSLSDPGFVPDKLLTGVNPMVETTWGQGCFYNEDCPVDSSATTLCYHTPTGCGATAMAQIMKYWETPEHGTGSHSYFHPTYGTLSANFGASTYVYSLMPPAVSVSNPEVAQLMFHCGVAQEMDYGPAGSSSYSSAIDAAFKTYFDYNPAINWKWREAYSSSIWNSMLASEMDAGRPVIYYGNDNGQSGHFFICDGYQGTDFFHFNWGWEGYLDGYFYTSDLTPGSNSFNDDQGALFSIIPNQLPPPSDLTMDFEQVSDFSLIFTPWTVFDADGKSTYQIADHTFPHSGDPMAFIAFNPAGVTPSMSADTSIQPHSGSRFGACFAATTPPNNDWFISPQVLLEKDGEFSFWVKSYTSEYGLERYRVGVSTTGTNPGDFTIISGGGYLEAPLQWTKKTFSLSAYNDQTVYVAINCVSDDAFIFMIDDLEVNRGSQGGLPSYMTLDFEGLSDFTLDFDPWSTEDVNGGNTYGIENTDFEHSGEPFAYICFNPGQTTPPLTNMQAHSGSRLGTCFSSVPPNNPNNKWLISPQMQFGTQPEMSLWVKSYSDQYGLEQFNIGVSNTGQDPSDFVIVNTGGPETAPTSWTLRSFNLGGFAGQAVYVGIQCVSDDRFIFMIDDIVISGNVGLEDETKGKEVTVYPNPAREKIYVSFGEQRSRNIRLRLVNTFGQVVYSDAPGESGGIVIIPIMGFPPGLYYLEVQNDDGTVVKKITILE